MLCELALFAGAGGGILGGLLLGWRTICAVEIDPYCRSVLLARQRDGILPRFPIWDDVRTFRGEPWRGHIDIITGGFPCQDISSAGTRTGLEGARSGLWTEYARILREVRPAFALVENSSDLTRRGLGVILGDLAALGYDASWGVLGAGDAGAPHRRERIWIVAHAHGEHGRARLGRASSLEPQSPEPSHVANGDGGDPSPWDLPFAGADRMADGVAVRVDRTRAAGNGQVPAVVRLAWRALR